MSIMVQPPFPPCSIRSRYRGFTLVELMVVIMIVAALAVLSLYLTRNFKTKAYQTSALNSMRQVATANAGYSMENNGDINVLLQAGDIRGAGDVVSKSFWGRLIPHLFDGANDDTQAKLKTDLTLRLNALFGTDNCLKMDKTFQKGATIYKDDSGLPVPFAFNENVYKADEYFKTQNFQNPSQILYMTYGSEYFNEADGQTYVPIPTGGKARSNNIDWFSSKNAVFSFLDGHVEILTPGIPARRFQDP